MQFLNCRAAKGTPALVTTSRQPKRKVVEIEPEPACTEVSETARSVDLLISAVADYAKFSCDTSNIAFRDTLMFQSRVYE